MHSLGPAFVPLESHVTLILEAQLAKLQAIGIFDASFSDIRITFSDKKNKLEMVHFARSAMALLAPASASSLA